MDNNNAESTSSHSHLESQAPSQQPSLLTTEDAFCEQYFQQSTIRLESGEYTTSLPKKLSTQELGDSYNQALSRFISLENKLKKQPEIKKQYQAFMNEYAALRHMSIVTSIPTQVKVFFLPHHCVHKQDSTTTKLRTSKTTALPKRQQENQLMIFYTPDQPYNQSCLIQYYDFDFLNSL